MDINKVILVGRLVRDPEIRTTPDGIILARLRIAVNRRPTREGEPQASFIDVVAWRKLAELCQQMLRKGARIAVDGSLRQYSWQGQDGKINSKLEVEAQNIQFLDRATRSVSGEVAQGDNHIETPVKEPDETTEPLHVLNGDLDDELNDFVFEGGES